MQMQLKFENILTYTGQLKKYQCLVKTVSFELLSELSNTNVQEDQPRITTATLGLIWVSGISENLNKNVDQQNNTEKRPSLNRCICYVCHIL